jgi:uncharacterized protein (TIGR02246 family)
MDKNMAGRSFCSIPIIAVVLAAALMLQTTASYAGDEAGVRQAGKDYVAAVEHGDTKALTEMWTADGTFTDENGRTTKARDALAKTTGSGHVTRPAINLSHITVRFLTDDVAVEDADTETTPSSGRAPVKGHYTATWVRKDGRWKLDSLKETRVSAAASNSEELASLGLFAGEWSGQMGQNTIHISAKWDATKKFLRREISVSGVTQMSGTQEIGLDPATGRLKSWTFLDDGSYGEGLWSLQGTVWMEASSRMLPDGKVIKAVQAYKFPDKNTLNWKLIRGSVDGQPAPAMEVVLKRS